MSDEDKPEDKPRIGFGYPLAQLFKVLFGKSERAEERLRKWQQVIDGMSDGTLEIGSRLPVKGTPAWITLEVVHGGFATGGWAAAGPIEADEKKWLDQIPRSPNATERGALNLWFAGEEGRRELNAELQSGKFRAKFPEEGALLIVAWLIEHGHGDRAAQLLETLLPFVDRLRFYPRAHAKPAPSGETVHVEAVGPVLSRLRNARPKPQISKMNEALAIWRPMADRAVALFVETVEDDWPCRRFPDDWKVRARALLDDYKNARETHQLCGKPERKKENFARLRGYLEQCLTGAITPRDAGMIRKILASHLAAHGAPDSERFRATRKMQARIVSQPGHHLIRRVLASRLEEYGEDEGIPDLAPVTAPIGAAEAGDVPAGTAIPAPLIAKIRRAGEGTIASLISQGVIGSGEVLALVLPHLTGQIRSAGIEDAGLRRAYHAVYTAFRRRRSLLLLNLEHQIKLDELPWISAIKPWLGDDTLVRDGARRALFEVARLNFESFPETITPNKLVRELRALSSTADLKLPFTDELAADIFMGAFSGTFLAAAKIAARLMRGTLYERYYSMPSDQVLELDDLEKRHATSSSPGFFNLCKTRARGEDKKRWSVAANGVIIEQAQILTTHNLAALFDTFPLAASLPLASLAERCFRFVCKELTRQNPNWKNQLQSVKNSAYAWRQMIFYLSFAKPDEVELFLRSSSEHLEKQKEDFRARFTPALADLRRAIEGETLPPQARLFLGWTIGRHWIFPPRAEAEN